MAPENTKFQFINISGSYQTQPTCERAKQGNKDVN